MITLTATYGVADETAPTGYVDIQPMITAVNLTTIITQAPVRGTLDAEGKFTVQLVASDDAGWDNGPIPYIFREFVNGQTAQWMAYVNGPGPVDISDLVPLSEAPVLTSMRLDDLVDVDVELAQNGHYLGFLDGMWVPIAGGGGGGGVTDHGMLTGLADDDHPQYQKESERGAANGYAPLDASSKVPAANLPTMSGGVTDHGGLTGLADDDHPLYPVMVNQPAEPAAPVADRPALWFDIDAEPEVDSTFVRYTDAYLVKAGPFTSLDGTWRPFCTLSTPDAPPGTYRYNISVSWIADAEDAGLLLRDRANGGTWSTYYQQAGSTTYWRNFVIEYPIVRSTSGPVTIELEGRRESGTAYVEAKYVDLYIQRMR